MVGITSFVKRHKAHKSPSPTSAWRRAYLAPAALSSFLSCHILTGVRWVQTGI